MSEKKTTAPRAIYLVVAAVLILATLSQWLFLKYGNSRDDTPYMDDGISATILYDATPIIDFELSDHNGAAFSRENLIGKWSFLSFGYTHCPDICPTTLKTLNHVDEILRENNSSIIPQTVFITLDPERDDVSTLAEYVPWFNKDFIGLTGTQQKIAMLTKNLGVLKQQRPDESGEGNYLIDHTVTIMLIDNRGRLRALSSPPHEAQTIVNDFIKITERFD
ncbi:MAG: SCO family protein [Gammaproteobacteria bacterium]|jgi:protein SCO1/2|nr:SCO family protein [Gammaproteobacteria bacterium]